MIPSYHHQLALFYSTRGIKVFPCREKDSVSKKHKAPYTNRGHLDATTLKKQIDMWWTKYPDALVGMPCKDNGIIVLDADRHSKEIDGVANLHNFFENHSIDVTTLPAVQTPNNGEHYLFIANGVPSKPAGKFCDGVDVKYEGYIIAAGSILPNAKGYVITHSELGVFGDLLQKKMLPALPSPVVERLFSHTKPLLNSPSQSAKTEIAPPEYIKAAITDEARELAGVAKGDRNNRLRDAAFRIGTIDSKGASKDFARMQFYAACHINGLVIESNDSEFRSVFDRCYNKGQEFPRESLEERDSRFIEEANIKGLDLPLLTPQPNSSKEARRDYANLKSIADYRLEPIEWLWPNRIALGKLTIIAGDPGLGKSQLTAYIAAQTTTAGNWPNNEGKAPLGSVIILSCEDDPSDTIKPRLMAAKADQNKCHILNVGTQNDLIRVLSLKNDLAILEEAILKLPDLKLIIIDPVTAYLDNIDSHRTSDVRGILAPIQELAQKHSIAVVAISHLNKNGGNGKAINSITGSGAFVAAARAAFLVAADRDDSSKRYLAEIKNNIGNSVPLSFHIDSTEIIAGVVAPYVSIDPHPATVDVNSLLAPPLNDDTKSRIDEAVDFLRTTLESSPKPSQEVIAEAKSLGISETTLNRAKKSLEIKSSKGGYQGQWCWELADQPKAVNSFIDTQTENMRAFEKKDHLWSKEQI